MVFFNRLPSKGSDRMREPLSERLRGASMEPFHSIPSELCAEQGMAYLRLLNQLARCGLDAAGPPLIAMLPR